MWSFEVSGSSRPRPRNWWQIRQLSGSSAHAGAIRQQSDASAMRGVLLRHTRHPVHIKFDRHAAEVHLCFREMPEYAEEDGQADRQIAESHEPLPLAWMPVGVSLDERPQQEEAEGYARDHDSEKLAGIVKTL